MTLEVAVLVSIGRHPVSGRPRPAAADARALDLALGLPGARVRIVHAGDPGEAVLRDYLGMGAEMATVLAMPPDADPLPALIEHLRSTKPGLVLAGLRAEAGEDSGLLPYLVAEGLGSALLPGIVGLAIDGEEVEALQALPRGRRRRIAARLPALVTVPATATAPRMSAYGRARRGQIETIAASAPPDEARAGWEVRPARRRPKRLRVMKAASAADRIRAVTETAAGKGRILQGLAPDAAAKAILDYLIEEGIIQPKA
ncbi:MAG: electron transfer flavoprotein subunit beta [Alphaproteobacteria bacterium]